MVGKICRDWCESPVRRPHPLLDGPVMVPQLGTPPEARHLAAGGRQPSGGWSAATSSWGRKMLMHVAQRIRNGAVAFALTGLAGPAGAQFVNPGFEVPGVAPGFFLAVPGGGNYGGWSVVGNDVLFVHGAYAEPGNGIFGFNAHGGLV